MAKPLFKTYQQNQVYLFLPRLEDMIDINHPVNVVSEVMDRMPSFVKNNSSYGFVVRSMYYKAKARQ